MREKHQKEGREEWHSTWISKQGLKKERLWTDKAIATFLGEPENAGPIKAWRRSDVRRAEKTAAFKKWMIERKAWLAAREK